jgi:predicted permease
MNLSIQLSVRRIRRDAGMVTLSILVLGLGLGVNLSLFNSAYAIIWRALDFPHPEELFTVSSRGTDGTWSSAVEITGSQAASIRRNVQAARQVGVVVAGPHFSLLSQSGETDLSTAAADSGYFRALQITPFAGQFPGEGDDLNKVGEVHAVLTYSAWERSFHRDPGVVGRTFSYPEGATLRTLRIVAIAPSGISLPFASDAELITALASRSPSIVGNDGDALYSCVLRLREGLPTTELTSELRRSFQELNRQGDDEYRAQSLRAALEPADKRSVLLLAAAGILLLGLTGTNLASLFASRAVRQSRDTAIHLALGCSRGRLLLSYLCEAWIICLIGTLVALVLNLFTRPIILWIFPELRSLGPDLLRVGPALLLVSAAIVCLVGMVVALPAASLGLRADIQSILSSPDHSGAGSAARWPTLFLVTQMAIVVVLLLTGGLLLHSFSESLNTDPGFDSTGLITFRVSEPVEPNAMIARLSAGIEQVRADPMIDAAAYSSESPVGGSLATVMNTGGSFAPADPAIAFRMVGPQYFETLRARLASGRFFADDEIKRGDNLIILNESAARLLFHGAIPLGKTVHGGFLNLQDTVIGVIKDIRHQALDQPSGPVAYIPYRAVFPGSVSFIVRSSGNPPAVYADLQTRMRTWNPPVYPQSYQSVSGEIRSTVHSRFVLCILVGCFAVLGLIVTSLGLYGVLAAEAHRRTREIGIRMSLGAGRLSVVWLVVRRGAFILGLGMIIGTVASVIVAHLIRSMLYGVAAFDPLSQIPALLFVVFWGVSAGLLPAVHGVRIAPMAALREP